jgi:two-component system cell cycle sensor histidine kinase/response regulator CckA
MDRDQTKQQLLAELAELRGRSAEAIESAHREIAIQNRIAEVFLTVPDHQMYDDILAILLDVTHSEYGVLGFVDEHGDLITPTMTRSVWEKCQVPDKRVVFPRATWGDSSWCRALREKQTLCINEPSTRTPEGHIPIRRHIAMPLVHRGAVVGLVSVANSPSDYSREDVALLEAVGRHIAPVFDARLHRQRQEAQRRRAEDALREREEQARSVLAAAMDGFWMVDAQGCLVDVNEAACRLLGYTRDELIYMRVGDIEAAESAEEVARHLRLVVETGSDRFESRHRRKDGQAIDVEISATWQPTQQRILCFLREITERKRTQEALQHEAAMRGILLENLPCMAMILKKGTREIVYSNEAARKAGAVLGKTCYGTCAQRGDPCPFCLAPEVWATNVPLQREAEYGGRYYEGRWTPLSNDLYVHYIFDITERKQTEAALRESEQRLRLTFDRSPIGAAMVSLDYRFVRVNEMLCRITGYSSEELTELTFPDITHPDDLAKGIDLARRLAAGEIDYYEMDKRYIRKDGEVVWIHLVVRLVEDASGQPLCYLPTMEDITRRKRAEEERRQLELQLLHAQKLESLGVLAGGIAHDFNNVLAGIRMFADVLETDPGASAAIQKHAGEIKKATQQGANMTRQILTYAGKGPIRPELLDLSEIVEDTRNMLEVVVSKRAVLKCRLAADLAALHADAGQMRQVLMNLVVNAAEAIGDNNGSISISTRMALVDNDAPVRCVSGESLPRGTYVCLEVADTGCGMDQATLDKVFDPFFSTKFTGRGRGLATVHGIILAHRGGIQVSSNPGKGSTFRIFRQALRQRHRAGGRRRGDGPLGNAIAVPTRRIHGADGRRRIRSPRPVPHAPERDRVRRSRFDHAENERRGSVRRIAPHPSRGAGGSHQRLHGRYGPTPVRRTRTVRVCSETRPLRSNHRQAGEGDGGAIARGGSAAGTRSPARKGRTAWPRVGTLRDYAPGYHGTLLAATIALRQAASRELREAVSCGVSRRRVRPFRGSVRDRPRHCPGPNRSRRSRFSGRSDWSKCPRDGPAR